MSPHSRAPHGLCVLVWRVCVHVCVYSIINPVGDSHNPTWNFLNKGLIFRGSCCTVKEGGPLSFSWMYQQNQTLKTKLCVETSGTLSVFYCQSVVSLKQPGIITQAKTSWLYSSANYFSFLKNKCLYAFDHIVNLLLWKNLHIYSLTKIILETIIDTQTMSNAGSQEIWLLQRRILPYYHLF